MSKKTTTILYWVTTGLFAAFMLMAGVVESIQHISGKEIMDHLGYAYFNLTILGVGKVLAAVALLLPPRKFTILKEWAYAGLAFTFFGAFVARLSAGDDIGLIISPVVFFAFMMLGYTFWKKLPRS